MATDNGKKPECFGVLDKVFPLGADGLRHTPEGCMGCAIKTACLRAAIGSKEGVKLHEEKLDRAWSSGSIGFLERWSKKKSLERMKRSGK